LRGLDVLTKLGYIKDKGMEDAVKILMQKQTKEGKWMRGNTPSGRMQVNIETKGKPSKWITLFALKVLKHMNYF